MALWNEGRVEELIECINEPQNVEEAELLFASYLHQMSYARSMNLMRDRRIKDLYLQEGKEAGYYLNCSRAYWYFGRLEDCLHYIELGLSVATIDDELKLKLLTERIEVNANLGNYRLSLEEGKEAMELAREVEAHLLYAVLCHQVGYVHQVIGNLDTATSFYYRGLEILRDGNHSLLTAAILRNLSKVSLDEGLVDEAMDILLRAIDIQERSSPVVYWELAQSLQRMVEYTTHMGDMQSAGEYLQRLEGIVSNSINLQLQHLWWFANGLYYEGAFLQTGDLDLLSRSRSSYQRLVYSSKVRQELRIASVCRYLQLLLISGSDGLDTEFRDLFFRVKGDVEREPHKTFLLSLKEIESQIHAIGGNFEKAMALLDASKSMAFENGINRKLMDLFRIEKEVLKEMEAEMQEPNPLMHEVWGNVTPDLYRCRFIFNPVRLSIVKWLLKFQNLTTVELKDQLGLPWGVLNTHLESLRKKEYIETHPIVDEGGIGTMVSLNPKVVPEFRQVISLLKVFVENIGQY